MDGNVIDLASRKATIDRERELDEVRERIRGIFTASIAERLAAVEARLSALEKSCGASS
jgi:hypothetical protein